MDRVYYVLLLITIVLTLLYRHLTKTFGYWAQRLMPCVPARTLPGLGNSYPMLFLKRNMADMFRDYYNQMPDHSMIGYYHLRQPALIVRDPELVKTVLSQNFDRFCKNNFDIDEKLDPLFSANPFFAEGDIWKISRQQLSAAFTSGKLKHMYETIDEVCTKLDNYIDTLQSNRGGKVELELKELFTRYTAEVVASAAFSVDGGSFKSERHDGPFKEIGRLLFEPTFAKGLSQIGMLFVPSVTKRLKLSFMPTKADRFFRKVIREVLKYREERNIDRPDFLQFMIQLKQSGAIGRSIDQAFDDDLITAHASSFFGGGYETSSITLSFLVYQLAAHPEVQERVRQEVNTVTDKHGGLTFEAIQEMTYMDRAMNESMRLFPAFGAFMKVCNKEFEMIGSDGMTCKVDPGVCVVIPAAALQRDPKHWPDPDKFLPDRFLDEENRKRHKFVYLPFGEGPRICPGQKVATLQIKAAVATVVQNYNLEVSPRTKQPIRLNPYYVMSAAVGGLWVNFTSLKLNNNSQVKTLN